jgi:hypothetical protein
VYQRIDSIEQKKAALALVAENHDLIAYFHDPSLETTGLGKDRHDDLLPAARIDL